MSDSFAIRTKITDVLYQTNPVLTEKLLDIYSEILSKVYTNETINRYLLSIIYLYNGIYETTFPADSTTLLPNQIKYLISEFSDIVKKGRYSETSLFTLVSIHNLFYRVYIKGGSAIKFLAQHIKKLDSQVIFPDELLKSGDLDSNIILNPYLSENHHIELFNILKNTFFEITLKVAITQKPLFDMLAKELVTSINGITELLDAVSLFTGKADVRYSLPTADETTVSIPNYLYSMKPYNNSFKVSTIKMMSSEIDVIRLMLEVSVSKDTEHNVGNTEAELIDFTFYYNTRSDIKFVWKTACNTMYISNNTIYLSSFTDIISDIQLMLSKPSTTILEAKRQKRLERLELLKKLYCYNEIIQEYNVRRRVNFNKIRSLCHDYVKEYLDKFSLDSTEKEHIIPFILGNTDKSINVIIKDFIAKYIVEYSTFYNTIDDDTGRKLVIHEYSKSLSSTIDKLVIDTFNKNLSSILGRIDGDKMVLFYYLVKRFTDHRNLQMNNNTLFFHSLYSTLSQLSKNKSRIKVADLVNMFKTSNDTTNNLILVNFINPFLITQYPRFLDIILNTLRDDRQLDKYKLLLYTSHPVKRISNIDELPMKMSIEYDKSFLDMINLYILELLVPFINSLSIESYEFYAYFSIAMETTINVMLRNYETSLEFDGEVLDITQSIPIMVITLKSKKLDYSRGLPNEKSLIYK
jgi:hypothetical protein